jgi:hypothetical protein
MRSFCLLLGAAKAGTTSFYNCFKQHPGIRPGRHKEIHFFDQNFHIWDYPQYEEHFKGKGIFFEASPFYLFHPRVPERVLKWSTETNAEVRFLVLLRNPVDRAYSHYHFQKARSGGMLPLETLSTFEQAIDQEDSRITPEMEGLTKNSRGAFLNLQTYSYLARSRYFEQLERWFSFFPQEQFCIIKSENYFQQSQQEFRRATDFLGLFNFTFPEPGQERRGNYPPLEKETRDRLERYFAPHNENLFKLTGIEW